MNTPASYLLKAKGLTAYQPMATLWVSRRKNLQSPERAPLSCAPGYVQPLPDSKATKRPPRHHQTGGQSLVRHNRQHYHEQRNHTI